MDLPRILMVANYYPQVGGISGLVKNLSMGLQKMVILSKFILLVDHISIDY
jgi:hypothetical protein